MTGIPRVEPVAAPLGAIVRDADFADQNDELIELVRSALVQHQVLAFRGHTPPTDAQLFEFASSLGTVKTDDKITPEFQRPGIPGISIMSNIVENGRPIGSTGSSEIDWHTDYSFRGCVSKMLFLDAVEVPRAGGTTYFANMYAAYETLPAELRADLAQLRIEHTLHYVDDVHGAYEERAVHPAVITNPASGRRALYLSPSFHPRFVDLPDDRNEDLVRRLKAWAGDDRFVYGHPWRSGDLLLWDSIGTIHRRDAFSPDDRRLMRKMSILVDDEAEPWTQPALPGASAR